MKKYLLLILLSLAVPGLAFGADYFGCASAAINADSTFCATPSGSCAGSDPVTAATALAGTHNLYANGCTISFADANFTAAKISTEDGDGAGAAVAGGGFTLDTASAAGNTYTTNIVSGGSDCLTITGNGSGTPVDTIVGDITGGSGAGFDGVNDSHTVGTINVTGNLTGGSNATARGYWWGGTSGSVAISGNSTGVTSVGLYVGSNGSATVAGNCVGSSTAVDGVGCYSTGGTGGMTITGNLISGTKAVGAAGAVRWTPAVPANGVTGHYVKFDGGGTAIYVGSNTDDASKALTTFYFVDPTDGTSDQGSSAGTGGPSGWAN